MINAFVRKFDDHREDLKAQFAKKHPNSYGDIVKMVINAISEGDDDSYDLPSAERITCIDHGEYQGTLLFIIASGAYQPDDYWYVKVGYGSCSVCDTLESIRQYGDEPPQQDQIDDYMNLALHIVQGIKRLGDE